MLIAIDEAIPFAQAAFSGAGELRLLSGRSVRPIDVRDADALVVRSVTRVGAALLESSSVRFVGTATIGTDHLDIPYLAARGIPWANAAGSNANAVAEYVVSALLALAGRNRWELAGRSIGIIGVGRIGSLVEKKAAALGLRPLLCDPLLRDSTGDPRYGLLEDVLHADILSLHVPLTGAGPYPTRQMFDRQVLARLSAGQYLINTSRGGVVCGPDLKAALAGHRLRGAILDVWEGEPEIDAGLLDLVELGTAHIAGSSIEGKARGTAMVLEELCRHFGLSPQWDPRNSEPAPKLLRPENGAAGQDAVWSVVRQAYDIRGDDERLRALVRSGGESMAAGFDRLRDGYALRPEFARFAVATGEDPAPASVLWDLGFASAAPEGHSPRGTEKP